MAKSKFEYVKDFEQHTRCLPNTWILVRVDGKGFHNFAEKHSYKKPNDLRGLNLMTTAACGVMREFTDIVLAFGHSDEYSFLLRRDSDIYNRRVEKILTAICSSFTSHFVFNWSKHFDCRVLPLLYPPVFDARIVLYPSNENVRDYFSWRQADVHINNLYNTCFWNLVQEREMSNKEAEEMLKGTVSSDKNELLFTEFGINYNNEPDIFRKGTTLMRRVKKKSEIVEYHGDIIGDTFWDDNPHILNGNVKLMPVKKFERDLEPEAET